MGRGVLRKWPEWVDTGDLSTLVPVVNEPEDVAKQFLEMATAMSALQQKDCKVMGGLQDGDAAIIQVQASQMKIRQATDVTMVKEASGWKVKKEGAWHNP